MKFRLPYHFVLVFAMCSINTLHAQYDSLLQIAGKASADSTRIRIYLSIASVESNRNTENTIKYANEALKLAVKSGDEKSQADARTHIAYAVYYSGNSDSAEVLYNNLIADYRRLGDSSGVATCLNRLGFIYREKGERPTALKYYTWAVQANKNNVNPTEAANSYLNIGVIHNDQRNFKEALRYENMALELYLQLNDDGRTGNAYARIGNTYSDMKDDSTALEYYLKSYELFRKAKHDRGIGVCLNNISLIYMNWKMYDKSLEYLREAKVIRDRIGDKNGLCIVYNNLGSTHYFLENTDSAIYYGTLSLELAKALEYGDMMRDNYHSLAKAYYQKGEYKTAYKYYELYHEESEKVMNDESTKQINELNTAFETERKEKQIELLTKEGELRQATLQKQRIVGIFLVAGFLMLSGLAWVIWRNARKTKKTNVLLAQQKAEITEQKKIVEEQHRDIVDSINYAQRIQTAVLPDTNELKRLFPSSFVFYRPRDIVSGDFWWIAERGSKKFVIVADCTGHGVPGAFMSLIGTTLLNEIINEKGITDPGEILNMLNDRISLSLHQKEDRTTAKDGMDIVVCCIDSMDNKLKFAGAHNPLYWSDRQGKIQEIKGDRQPVGFYVESHKPFQVNTLPLDDIKAIYLFTDGYADQFCGNGGPQQGKKFKYSRLKDKLEEIQMLDTNRQESELGKTFDEWKGEIFQVDDVLLMGIKISNT